MWGLKGKDETRRPPRRGLAVLARDRRGATIIEFAAVAAPFFALIFATIQTSFVFFAQQTLETVSEEVSRQLVTGAAQSSNMEQPEFLQTACNTLQKSAPFMSCANLMVDVQTADTFEDVDSNIPDVVENNGDIKKDWQYHPGGPGKIVVMRTMYLLPVISGPLGFNLANVGNGRRLIVATAVFKIEPYLS